MGLKVFYHSGLLLFVCLRMFSSSLPPARLPIISPATRVYHTVSPKGLTPIRGGESMVPTCGAEAAMVCCQGAGSDCGRRAAAEGCCRQCSATRRQAAPYSRIPKDRCSSDAVRMGYIWGRLRAVYERSYGGPTSGPTSSYENIGRCDLL